MMFITVLGLGFAIFKLGFLALLSAMFHRPVIYKIADNYKGWAVVRYDDPSCPPLQHENVFMVIPISSSGEGCTSGRLQKEWAIHLYEYVSRGKVVRQLRVTRWGGGGEIWAGYGMPYKHSEAFFIGTESELRQRWAEEPR